VLLAAAGPARGHNLGATAHVRGDQVEVEAYFSDDTPARDARVTVHDAADQIIAEGRADDAGRWRFRVPPDGVYRVVVDAGGGHRRPFTVRLRAGGVASDEPPRAEFTRFPWGGVAAGLTVIVLLAVGWRAWRGVKKS
jgi:hypothetical protein